MATDFEIFLNADQHGRATESALQALDLVEELEGQLTMYRPHSEVMGINGRAADGPVAVEARLFAMLQLAVNLSRNTGGAFDITSGPLSQVWGFYPARGSCPTRSLCSRRCRAWAIAGWSWTTSGTRFDSCGGAWRST